MGVDEEQGLGKKKKVPRGNYAASLRGNYLPGMYSVPPGLSYAGPPAPSVIHRGSSGASSLALASLFAIGVGRHVCPGKGGGRIY